VTGGQALISAEPISTAPQITSSGETPIPKPQSRP
jgi:hypothetical protein